MSLIVGSNISLGNSASSATPRKSRYSGGAQFSINVGADGPNTRVTHLGRIITQADWGYASMLIHIRKTYYQPGNNSWYKLTAYYDNFTLSHLYGNTTTLLQMQNFGVGGSLQIHENSNGGYYRDAWGKDLYVSIGGYNAWALDFYVHSSGGFLKDTATPLTNVYPASFDNTPSQSEADNWSYGRGCWFNVQPGTVGY